MEIRRAFDFYESSSKKRAISKVLLSGGSAKLKNIDRFINEKLKIPIELHNPFSSIEIENLSAMEEKVKEFSIYLPVSVGLSVRRVK